MADVTSPPGIPPGPSAQDVVNALRTGVLRDACAYGHKPRSPSTGPPADGEVSYPRYARPGGSACGASYAYPSYGQPADDARTRVCLDARCDAALRVSCGLERLRGESGCRGYLYSFTPPCVRLTPSSVTAGDPVMRGGPVTPTQKV